MAIPTKIIMSPSNTQIVRFKGLYWIDPTDVNETRNYFDNTATVTATLLDSAGNAVTGLDGLVCGFVAGSSGNFAAAVGADFDVTVGHAYTMVLVAVQGSAKATWRIPVEIDDRVGR